MNPLRIAVLVKDKHNQTMREDRAKGIWSYPVPEFTWEFFRTPRGAYWHRGDFTDYDVLWIEDSAFPLLLGTGGPPVVGNFWDSTWTEGHFQERRTLVPYCDLVLIDHDDLARWQTKKRPTRRFLYSVNDHLFHDHGNVKTVGIGDHQNVNVPELPGAHERQALAAWLKTFCQGRYTLETGSIIDHNDYAASFARARISVNWPRVPQNRPFRIYDAMASRSCLLTGPCPNWPEEGRVAGENFITFRDYAELGQWIDWLLTGSWSYIADAGYNLMRERHTWAVRARELRELLSKELGL